jgi:Ran GTPase-activating protein (RanGAP) involved in mRNA processing and transport
LTGNGLDDSSIQLLSQGIIANRTTKLEFLSLDFNAFGDAGVAALSKLLLAQRLQELHLFGNRVTAKGAAFLATALRQNTSLQSLILSFNQIGDDGAAALASALTVNVTLQNLWFPSNAVGVDGMQAFANHLPRMRGLNQLNVGMLLDDQAAEALTDALKLNSSLSILHMEQPFELEEEEGAVKNKDLDFYLRLNRSGRRLLKDEKVDALWPNLLSRTENGVTPDALYYLLCEKPELVNDGKQ